jgi:hypothetical protein
VYEDPYTIELVLDFIPGGELFEVIVEKGFFSENDASWMIHQVQKYYRDTGKAILLIRKFLCGPCSGVGRNFAHPFERHCSS